MFELSVGSTFLRTSIAGMVAPLRAGLAGAALVCLAPLCWAQAVTVQNAWARATVPGQTATGVFMQLTASADTRLVAASTPVAGFGEVHEMLVENNVMRMRALPDGLPLPAGKPVELRPGAMHLMLMDLRQPLTRGTTMPLTLVFRNAKGVEQQLEIKVPVSMTAPAPADSH